LFSGAILTSAGQDLPNSKDPAGMKRYEGSEIIGYRSPMFDEYLLPVGPPTNFSPPVYEKSKPVEGQVSYYTYLAPAGRSPAELFRNYKQEFQRLGIEVQYEKNAGQPGDFGSTFDKIDNDCDLAQILTYDGADERLMVGQSRDAKPIYYMVFVTAYNDGVIPERLEGRVQKGRALAQLVVISPDVLEKKMAFLNADDMKRAIHDSGEVAVYGLYFDTDKDAVKSESQSALAEIAKLLKSEPPLRLHVVGHTDNQGKPDHNLDLSHRRAASVVAELTKPPPPDLCTHSRQEGRQASGPLRGLFMYAERFIHFNRRFESGGVVSGTCRSQILPVSAVIPTGAVLCCPLQSSAPNSKCRLGNYT